MARDFGFNYVVRPNRGTVQEGRQPQLLLREDRRRPHPDPGRRLRAARRPARRAAAHGRRRSAPSCSRRSSSASSTRRTGSSAAPAPCRSSSTGPYRPPVRTWTAPSVSARAPSTGARPWADQRHHADRALRGHVHRLRPQGPRLGAARYVPVALSAGVCPDTAGAARNQRYRWCMGSLELLTSKRFWEMDLKFKTRLCYVGVPLLPSDRARHVHRAGHPARPDDPAARPAARRGRPVGAAERRVRDAGPAAVAPGALSSRGLGRPDHRCGWSHVFAVRRTCCGAVRWAGSPRARRAPRRAACAATGTA